MLGSHCIPMYIDNDNTWCPKTKVSTYNVEKEDSYNQLQWLYVLANFMRWGIE